jgi:hypothetical protein
MNAYKITYRGTTHTARAISEDAAFAAFVDVKGHAVPMGDWKYVTIAPKEEN